MKKYPIESKINLELDTESAANKLKKINYRKERTFSPKQIIEFASTKRDLDNIVNSRNQKLNEDKLKIDNELIFK